jgi:LPS sulfotransferase NodH
MRTCILCLPRSGSQYCENLIASLDDQCFLLSEYLEAWNESEYVLDNNSMIVIKNISAVKKPSSINSKYLDRLELLKRANSSQKFVLRLFMFDDYNLEDIVPTLGEIGFSFISLRRDFYSIAMSYTLARNYAIQGSPIWIINSQISKQINIDIDKTRKELDRLHTAFINWDDNLAKLSIDYTQMNYNTLVDDVSNMFGAVPKYDGVKTVSGDYLTHILNKDEVLKMMEDYTSDL